MQGGFPNDKNQPFPFFQGYICCPDQQVHIIGHVYGRHGFHAAGANHHALSDKGTAGKPSPHIPVIVNRNYTLPRFANNNSLIFAVSYSGNTEETLAAYDEARARGANIAVVTSGGKLKELAFKNKDALAIIPKGYPPRCALGYSFIPPTAMLPPEPGSPRTLSPSAH